MKCKAIENARTGWGLEWEDGSRSYVPNKKTALALAAAPDLLEACKRAVHLFDYDDATSVLEWVDSPEFRAAIAKAEGR